VSAGTRGIVLAVSTLALGMLALAAPASAATVTFNYTGAAQTWTVPAGVTEATFDLYGAQGHGGCCPFSEFPGGLGGRATATIPVTAGTSIQVNVGGQGEQGLGSLNGGAGFNGGGAAGNVGIGGWGGGGASDIRIGDYGLANRVLVAGGGGGAAGANCENPDSGGDGGGLSGKPGIADTSTACGGPGGVGGGGGTQTDGGSATSPATEGDFGVGGNGGIIGGGGGGGWFGGGGGNDPAGGGGGSGFGPPGTVFQTGVHSGDGVVTVTPTPTIDTLIQSVQAFALPSGITTSLLTKLNTAVDNLDAGNTAGACNQLGAFVAQVKRQSGMKIPSADADQLIADANDVRTSLSCGAALTCAGQKATIVGTSGPDRLKGTVGEDVIAAQGGDDKVSGLRGDDIVCGGAGADLLRGQGGDDKLRGGGGKDELGGGGGSNRCRGGKGADIEHHC
jgi:hypothetical protein